MTDLTVSVSWWQCFVEGVNDQPVADSLVDLQDHSTAPQRMRFLWYSILVFSRTILRLISIVKVLTIKK